MKFILMLFISLVAFASANAAFSNTPDDEIQKILTDVRNDLLTGEIDTARNRLDAAMENFHSVKLELASIQVLMQAGEYTHALSAAAHTQAEHRDAIDALLFYAWLLAIGGQEIPAKNLIQETTLASGKILLRQLEKHRLNAAELPLDGEIYFGPVTRGTNFTHRQNAIVLADGQHALTLSLVPNSGIQVRTATGQQINATVEKNLPLGACLLKLEKPILVPSLSASILRAGIPVYIVNLPISDRTQWPQLTTDVIGFVNEHTALYPLHRENLAPGSGVYNSAGELLGIVGFSADNKPLVIPVAEVLESVTSAEKPRSVFAGAKPVADIYQIALQQTLAVASLVPKE